MNNIIKIIKSLEDSGVLIDGVTDTVKHEIKKQKGGFIEALLAPLAALLVQLKISSVVNGISRRGLIRAGRRFIDKKVSYAPSVNYNRYYQFLQLQI